MPGLPANALAALEAAERTLEECTIHAVDVRTLSVPKVRAALARAARLAGEHEYGGVMYVPPHADALIILRVEDLRTMLKDAGRNQA